ncbi:MAG TPA: ion transporter [Alphaproteobacteria bacterium]|nr:ion transporter [Alphaproteobacteria bacterium]
MIKLKTRYRCLVLAKRQKHMTFATRKKIIHSKLGNLLESRNFNLGVVWLILINALVIGLETSQIMVRDFGNVLIWIESTILGLFVVEIMIRIFIRGSSYFKSGLNIFDFIVITVSLFPHAAGLSILRLFRVVPSVALFEKSSHMRHVVQAVRHVIPSTLSVAFLMLIAFYVLGVIGVELFSEQFPKQFGNLPWSVFTLFRLMVYDDYGIITRPILEKYPFSWIYFLLITLILAFVLINLFVAVVVTALQRAIETERDPLEVKVTKELKMLLGDDKVIQELEKEILELKEMIKTLKK